MAVAAAPSRRRSLIGQAVAAWHAWSPSRASRLAAFAARARQHIVTVAALTSVDVGAFHYGAGPGWIVTGVTLLAFDFAVTG